MINSKEERELNIIAASMAARDSINEVLDEAQLDAMSYVADFVTACEYLYENSLCSSMKDMTILDVNTFLNKSLGLLKTRIMEEIFGDKGE